MLSRNSRQPCVDVPRERGGKQRCRDMSLNGVHMTQPMHVIHAQRSVPIAEEQLYFPPNPVELCHVERGKDVTRQRGQVVAVLVLEGDAHHTGELSAAVGVTQLDVKIEGAMAEFIELARFRRT